MFVQSRKRDRSMFSARSERPDSLEPAQKRTRDAWSRTNSRPQRSSSVERRSRGRRTGSPIQDREPSNISRNVIKTPMKNERGPLIEVNNLSDDEPSVSNSNPRGPYSGVLDVPNEAEKFDWESEESFSENSFTNEYILDTGSFRRTKTFDPTEIPSGSQSVPGPSRRSPLTVAEFCEDADSSKNSLEPFDKEAELAILESSEQFHRDFQAYQMYSAEEEMGKEQRSLFCQQNFAKEEKMTDILVGTSHMKCRYIARSLQGLRQRRMKSEGRQSVKHWRKMNSSIPVEISEKSDPLAEVLAEMDPTSSDCQRPVERSCKADIADGKEARKIPKFDRDDVPYSSKSFKYIHQNVIHKRKEFEKNELLTCDCEGECGTDCNCVRNSLIAGGAFIMDNQVVVDDNLDFWKSLVVSCGPACCCRGRCSNSADEILKIKKLELFKKCQQVGWGVRTAELIRPGEVICEFRGEVITDEQQEKRIGSSAWTWLIYAKKHVDDRIDQSLMLLRDSNPEKCSLLEGELVIDPREKGNISRYVNHSELANATPIRLFTNDCRPENARLLFIATRHIAPQAEIFFDYGDQYDSLAGQSCLCNNLLCGDQKLARRFSWSKQEFMRALNFADLSIQMRYEMDASFQRLSEEQLSLICKKIALLSKRPTYISLEIAKVQDFLNYISRAFKPRKKKSEIGQRRSRDESEE